MRNRGQFKIHRGVKLSRVSINRSIVRRMFLTLSSLTTSKGRSNLIVSTGGVPLCKLLVTKRSPSCLQTNNHVIVSRRMLMKFASRFFFLPIPLQFVATPSISSLNCLPLSIPSPLFQLLFFEYMPFPSKLFTSGLRYFQPSFPAVGPGIFSTSVVLTLAFIRLSLAVTPFLFSRFPTFRSFFPSLSLSLFSLFSALLFARIHCSLNRHVNRTLCYRYSIVFFIL